jgi:hypothetical protein
MLPESFWLVDIRQMNINQGFFGAQQPLPATDRRSVGRRTIADQGATQHRA